MNSYDDSFVAVKLALVKRTPYDFGAPVGHPLGTQRRQDSFSDLTSSSEGEHGSRDHRSSSETLSAPLYVFAVGQVNPGECSTAKGFGCHRTVIQPARSAHQDWETSTPRWCCLNSGSRFPGACGGNCSRRASR